VVPMRNLLSPTIEAGARSATSRAREAAILARKHDDDYVKHWHHVSSAEVLQLLDVDPVAGLPSEEVARRLKELVQTESRLAATRPRGSASSSIQPAFRLHPADRVRHHSVPC